MDKSAATRTVVVLASRPQGQVNAGNFRIETRPVPPLNDGQLAVRVIYLSLDPYMRPRMTETKSYTPPFELDQPLTGGAVGEVIDSRNEKFAKGDIVMGMFGWESVSIVDGRGVR
jgi:NADPH-dependent curcumin reductase CurA